MRDERPLREDRVRAAALECLGAVGQERQLADRVLDRVLRREITLYSNERRAVAERVYGVLRRRATLDFAIDRAMGPRAGALSAVERDALRIAAWRVLEGEERARVERDAGVRVEQRKVLEALPGLAAAMAPLPPPERLQVEGSLPAFLARVLLGELGLDEALALMAALNQRAPLTARANLLKTTREALATALAGEGVETAPTRFSPWGLALNARVNAFSLEAFRAGLFELQDEGSQLLALLVGAEPGERVVDACAGAGGKTLALAACMRNQGELWALDSDAPRLQDLKPRARRAGVSMVRSRLVAADASAEAQLADLAGRADRVLVDAPCTGLGALRRNPDARWRLTPDDLPRFRALQEALLGRYARLVKPGGLLVYGTCSVVRGEDEEVAEAFLAGQPGFERAPARALLGELAGPLEVGEQLRLWPHRHGTDGFFGAAFRRIS